MFLSVPTNPRGNATRMIVLVLIIHSCYLAEVDHSVQDPLVLLETSKKIVLNHRQIIKQHFLASRVVFRACHSFIHSYTHALAVVCLLLVRQAHVSSTLRNRSFTLESTLVPCFCPRAHFLTD